MSNRNKSSMKPLRREPLQDLQMISAANSDEDTTSTITLASLAKRRVSFSGRNSIKEYVPCAEPICVMSTPAYEETFAHMSSDSSGLCNNSAQNDENIMSQTLVNKITVNRPHPVAPPTRANFNQIAPQPLQKYRNSLSHQQVATVAATQDDSLNTSDMCMTEPISTNLYASDVHVSRASGDMLLTSGAGDTSSGDMSITRRSVNSHNNSTCMNFTSAVNDTKSQNTSTCMSFTKAIVADFPADNSIIQNNSMSFTKAIVATDEKFMSQNNSSCMSFTKAMVVHDENSHVLSQSSSSHMSFTKAMVVEDDVLSQNSSTHMSLTKALVVNDENLQTDNVSSQNSSTHMSFTKAMVNEDFNTSKSFTNREFAVTDGNATMTLDDSVTNCKNATNFTLDPGTDEEMRRLLQEVEMEETLDSEKLKSYRLSDVSFLVHENLVSGKSKKAKRRSSIATISSNSPIDLSMAGNRFGQQNIDEEEEEEGEKDEEGEEEMEVEGGEEEGRGEKDESSSERDEVRNEEEKHEEARRLEEEDRRGREESDGLRKEEECERERRRDLKDHIEGKGLEEGGEDVEEERPEESKAKELEGGRLEEGRTRQREESNEDGGRGRGGEDVEEEEEKEDVVDRMETDAEIQSGKVNDLDMSIVEDNEEVTNGVKEKDDESGGKEEEALHLNLREETPSKKTEETFCLNLNSVSEMVECSVARDDEREEKECDEGGVKEEGTGSDKEQSGDSQCTRSTVVLATGREEQLLQEKSRTKRKSDSLDLSREEFDVVESPSKLARMEDMTSLIIESEAPIVSLEEKPPNSTPEIIANSSTTRKSRSFIGKRSFSSHSLDESRMSFLEMAESLLDASSSLNNSSRLSGAFSASMSAPTPLRYQQEEVAPHETRYSFYGGAMVVRAERNSGATEQLKAAEILVNGDAEDHCLIFANKTKSLFAEKVAACQSMTEVKNEISEINYFAYSHETQHKSLLRLWTNARLDIVGGRLKYNAVCHETMTWFSVLMDPDIIFEGLSDDAITVKSFVGDVQESYIKHLYRCCVMSPDRLKHFTDSIEKYVTSPKT